MARLGAFLNFTQVYGAAGGIRDNISHISDTAICFPAGRHLTIYNTDTREMSFVLESNQVRILFAPFTMQVHAITAMSISSNKKYIAVCERLSSDSPGQVSVFSATTEKRVRSLSHPDIKEFTACSFSADGRFLVTVGGPPDYSLIYWNWFQSKPIAGVKLNLEVKKISFSPIDNAQMASSGPAILKLWRLQENKLKAINLLGNKATVPVITDHTWAHNDRLLAVTDTGNILVFEQGELVHTIYSIWEGLPAYSIISHSSGFIVGGTGGRLSVFEKSDTKDKTEDKELYHPFKSFRCSMGSDIAAISLSPAEESIACFFNNNQVATFPLTNIDILKEDQDHFTFIGSGFHHGSITGMDVAIRKPLVVTSGADRTVRIWNYLDRTCDVVKSFPDDLFSVAIHPSGLHVLVGFSDKLRLFNVLLNELRQFQEFPVKSCRDVRFSHGGHMFAAVNLSNIVIYGTYTFEKIGVLISHTALVRCISWSRDDSRVVSAGMDGAVYEWSIQGLNRAEENVIRNVHYSSVTYNSTGSSVVACGDDGRIREIISGNITREVAVPEHKLTHLLLMNTDKILFAGTQSGSIQTYIWGTEETVTEGQEYILSQGPVTVMRPSPDDTHMFVGTEDGCVFVFEVHLVENGEVVPHKAVDAALYLDVVLVTKSDLEEKRTAMVDLENRIGEIQVRSS